MRPAGRTLPTPDLKYADKHIAVVNTLKANPAELTHLSPSMETTSKGCWLTAGMYEISLGRITWITR